MIQSKPKFEIDTDDTMASAKFSLKEENLAHVFNILRNNLYSDKILAVIREYSTNASDANIENNKEDLPIQVTLPTVIEPTLQIRDYGTGLSEYDVFNIYSSYGASTKRNTNKLVGTLGMGSKSGFAYANSFTITSWFDGVKKVYEAYIDETDLGTIAKMSEEPSSEPSGICVTIAVGKNDIHTFIDKAKEFYMWFSPVPTFYGVDIAKNIQDKHSAFDVHYKSDLGILYADSYYGNGTSLYVKMGGICYPVTNPGNIDVAWISNSYNKLIINAKIGEVSFTTSRESLEMTDMTIATIKRYMNKIRDEVAIKYKKEVDANATPWDAICYYQGLSGLPKAILNNNLIWRGEKLTTGIPGDFMLSKYEAYNKKWKYTNLYFNDKKTALIINDGGFPNSQHRARLMECHSTLTAEGYDQIIYAKGAVGDSLALLKAREVVGLKILKLSSISGFVIKSKMKAVKKTETIFKWNLTTSFPYSTCWSAVPADGPKVYVNIESFKPTEFGWYKLGNINNLFQALGITFELYGAKPKQKIHSDWVKLTDFLQAAALKIVSSPEYIKEYINRKTIDAAKDNWFTKSIQSGAYSSQVSRVKCPQVKKIMEMSFDSKNEQYSNWHELISIADSLTGVHSTKLRKAINDLDVKAGVAIKNINDQVSDCVKKYPLLNGFISCGYYGYRGLTADEAKHLTDYVNCMFTCG